MAKHKHADEQFSYQPEESTQAINHQPEKNLPPLEQITNNQLPDGLNDILTAPMDGTNIILMKDENDPGLMCYWRKTRTRKQHQWTTSGIWSHTLSRFAISFEPKYWREADAVMSDFDPSIMDKARIAELEKKVIELSRGR